VSKFTLTSEQVRAARMLLRWEQTDLALKSGMSLPTIKRIELIPGEFGAHESTLKAIRKAFENEGVSFFSGHALGVRLRKIQGELDACHRKSVPAVASRASKPVKAIKTTHPKKTRVQGSKRLK
jgi:transcriptional regulator with XRE-family HTH domain